MTSSAPSSDPIVGHMKSFTGRWWLYLISGIAWFLFAFLALTWNLATVWGIAVFAGIGLIIGGLFEFVVSSVVPSWKWVHVVFGVLSIAAGVLALGWPGQTFLVLAALLAWYLLFSGFFEVVLAFTTRELDELWWLRLLLGVAQILVGFWAVGYAGRSTALLIVWVAAAALARGLSNLFVAFGLHAAGKEIDRLTEGT